MAIIIPTEGLCNRLRVILSYLEKYSKLEVFWNKDDKICFTHFLDVFHPIENINFLETFPKTFTYQGFSSISPIENYKLKYRLLKPKEEIIHRLKTFLTILGNDFNACHIRRTDHTRIAIRRKLLTTDLEYVKFISNSPNKVYIATDNIFTQQQLKKIFGDKIVINDGLFSGKLRNSSLEDAFIDIVICSLAKDFKGSGYSSFTDTIQIFKEINYYKTIINDIDILV